MQNNASHLFPNKSGKDTGRTFEINLKKSNKLNFRLYNLDSLSFGVAQVACVALSWSARLNTCSKPPKE